MQVAIAGIPITELENLWQLCNTEIWFATKHVGVICDHISHLRSSIMVRRHERTDVISKRCVFLEPMITALFTKGAVVNESKY